MIKTLAKAINYVAGSLFQRNKIFISASLEYLQRKRTIDSNYFDYVRLATLELISHEISRNQLSGNVAELGVYKGKFARYINRHFPERTLYLFDTFQGFDKRDVLTENQHEFSKGSQNFSNTSVKAVLAQMLHPEKCVPVKGFFPESAQGVEDVFVFVSLDADLFEPIYAGLNFFYPRLVSGGYIFIHDFNNDGYKGARRAVQQFCSEQKINYLPLPDAGGSAVIMK